MAASPILAVALLGALPWSAHQNSLSGSRIDVEGARVRHELLLQPLGLMEVLPRIDADGDGAIDPAELAALRAEVAEYVARHYRLFADEGFARPLSPRTESIRFAPAPFPDATGARDWIEVVTHFEAESALEVLALDMRMFFLTSPDHRDFCSLSWDGLAAFETTLSRFEPQRVLRRADIDFPSWRSRLGEGWRAFALEAVHSVFLFVLLAGSTSVRSALRAALLFALARWLGFGYGLSGLAPLPARFVELSVALSSAFVGAQILTRREERALDLEALVFGLVHGLALALVAQELTAPVLRPLGDELRILFGIELAQGCLVIGALLLARMLARSPRVLVRGRTLLALFATLFGLYAFVVRAGWL